jgi:hypothetical protein
VQHEKQAFKDSVACVMIETMMMKGTNLEMVEEEEIQQLTR